MRTIRSLLAVVAVVLTGLLIFAIPTAATAASTKTIHATGGLDQTRPTCDGGTTMAYFVINQLASPANAPASITVSFAGGGSAVFPLLTVDGPVAKYQGAAPAKVTGATAVIYASWSGQFNLSHYFCSSVSTTTTTEATTTTTEATTTTVPVTTTSPDTTVPGVTTTVPVGTTVPGATTVPVGTSTPTLGVGRPARAAVAATGQLATTGRDYMPLTAAGGAALLSGGALVGLARRRARR